MIIDYTKVRRIILNDRVMGYKPDIYAIKKLTDRLPDAVIIGFGVYSSHLLFKLWYVLAYSSYFKADDGPYIPTVPINETPYVPLPPKIKAPLKIVLKG